MGITKQYLRYCASALFGVIASPKANIVFVTLRGDKGRYVAVAACEHVIIWDIRKGEKVLILKGLRQEVTCLHPSPDGYHLAVGYEDGSIRIFSLLNGESNITFNGHKAAVTVMCYDQLGARLASGSKDTDVIIWDVVNESGLYRLKGHKDAITEAVFLQKKNLLITSSKDTLVKWWDLDTQHCFSTVVGHRSEVWGLALVFDETRLLTGSVDSELRAWKVTYLEEKKGTEEPEAKRNKGSLDGEEQLDENPEDRILCCTKMGSIMRNGRDRVVSLASDRSNRIVGCHGTDCVLEVFYILSEDEVNKKMERKLKKMKKKAKQQSQLNSEEEAVSIERTLQDEVRRINNIKSSAKIRSFDMIVFPNGELRVALLLQNNTIESYTLNTTVLSPECNKTARITIGGHRSDVRTLAFSSDNIAILSASAETVKIWNRSTLQCIRTMPCDYALSSLFVPGDRQVIVGTKSGRLQLFDLATGGLLEAVEAHDGAVWSMSLSQDQRGFVTGGADKTVKFWEFELVKDDDSSQTSHRLSVNHMRTLQLDEDVLCVRFSPNQKLLAVSLLDCTVKIFYTDSLKFFLSLYGHKLPVLCMDISYDSVLIATGSADRNVKIWGLDFGDCHRSLFAHDDSVMSLQFVPKSHLFFTAGKDCKIKQWDADKFEHIQTLEGHHREVWCLAVSPNGDHVVSSSHDKSLRLWERTREPLILEEEREMQREAEFEESLGKGDEPVVPGETQGETGLAGKKTVETVKAAERMIEAVELYRDETNKLEEYRAACRVAGKEIPLPSINPILMAYGSISPSQYVLETFKKIKSSELEESLLVLPFSYVPDLLTLFNDYIQHGQSVELICRCLFFLLRIHFGQITSNQMLLTVMDSLRRNTIAKVSEIRDQLGFNLAGLQFLKREIEAKEDVTFFADATNLFEEKKKKKERAILAFS